jgi:PhzF family phenazine biosynthesis protein
MSVKASEVFAFVTNGEGGNRAGVVLNATGLTDKQMQHIAQEVGASETAFVFPDSKSTHKLRFFTPTVEVPLCGHATIATWSYMWSKGSHNAGNYTQNTKAGIIHISIDNSGLIFMEQPEQRFENLVSFEEISNRLHIADNSFEKTYQPQIVQHNLMVGVVSRETLNSLNLNMEEVVSFGKAKGFDGLHVFTILKNQEAIAAVRDFAPSVGIDEDAATGTANGSFLTYLQSINAIKEQPAYMIIQGEAMGQLSNIYGKFEKGRVWIGGKALESIEREVELK